MPFRLLPFLLLIAALPLRAQNWSVGAGAGPFFFGDFAERTLRLAGEDGTINQTLTLSADTRAGISVDLERRLGDRWAVRLEGTFTNAPLSVRGDDRDGVSLGAGDMDVTTFSLPVVFNINRSGSFRFHIAGGPAYASYRVERDEDDTNTIRVFTGTRSAWGVSVGGGVAWWLSDRFAIEGEISDVATKSPFREEDFPAAQRVQIERPHNIHTTAGIRYRF